MKAGKKPIQSDYTTVESIKEVKSSSIIISVLPILSMIIAILPGLLIENSEIDILKLGILTLILTAASSFYIQMNAVEILNKKLSKTIIFVSFLSSLCILILIPQPEMYVLWMLGGLLVSMLIDSKLGLLLNFNLSFLLGMTFSLSPETVIYLLIVAIIMSLLASSLKNKSTVIYASIILLSSNTTLSFVINNFMMDRNSGYNYMSSFFSILAIIIACFFICMIYNKKVVKDNSSVIDETIEPNSLEAASITEEVKNTEPKKQEIIVEDEGISAEEAAQSNGAFALQHFGSRTSYELLNEENNILLTKLKEHSESLYQHALRIGDISCRAAGQIGADEQLAKAGGYYHEIGKIGGKNYIEEGIKIAAEYAFPKELTLILKEHNIKYEKPTSVEAAIVMLTDNVVSTIEYIEKTGEVKYTPNKIIDNIFQMRMEKGTFDGSGLSVKDFKLLKEFFHNEFDKNEE